MAKLKTLKKCFLLGVASATLSGHAVAQETSEESGESRNEITADDMSKAEIYVTASRIAAQGFDAPTPTIVLGAEDVDRVGAASVADILTQVPAFSATGINQTNVETGALFANLRALGPERTLVLVDGRRHVATFSDGTMDLGVIPTALIQRVEIVTGGASATWGSDAVAGVINVILRKEMDGIEGEIQGGISDRGDAANYKVSLAGGTSFAGGRGNVVLAFEHSDDDGVRSLNDPFYARPYGGRNIVGNPAFATNGLPGTIYAHDVRAADYTSGGLITSGPLRGTQFIGNGSTTSFGFGQVFGGVMIGGTSNFAVRANHEDAKQPLERFNVFGRASFDVTDNITMFVEGSFARAITQGYKGYTVQRGVTTTPATCPRTTTQSRFGAIIVPVTNPFIPTAVRDQLVAAGVSCFSYGKSFEGPGLGQQLSNDGPAALYRGVAGVDAELGSDWTMNAYVQHGRSDTRFRRGHVTNVALMNNAIDAVQVGNQILCRINADAITTNDDPNCAPFNIFGDNVASPEAVRYVTATSKLDLRIEQTVAALEFGGPLLSLWAGDIYVAFGGEYRTESVFGVADPISQVGGFQTGNRSGLSGDYSVKEGFAELAIPLVKNVPFFSNVSLNLAGRLTDYSGSGLVNTWKAGVHWDVNDDVSLRATRSRDIRAGNIGELFTPTAHGATNIFDRNNVMRAVATITTGNAALDPEVANTFTAGVVLSPSWLDGFRASLDVYDITIRGLIATLRPQQVYDRCVRDGDTSYCDRITFAGDVLTSVATSFDNLNQVETRGLDIELRYTTPVSLFGGDAGERLRFSVLANYVDRLRLAVADTTNLIDPLGQYSNPNWTAFATAGYSNDHFQAVIEERFFEGGTIDNTKVEGAVALNGVNINSVPATWYTNLYLSYALNGFGERGPEVFGRIDNLLDQDPPFPSPIPPAVNTISNQSRNFSVVGRAFRVGVRLAF